MSKTVQNSGGTVIVQSSAQEYVRLLFTAGLAATFFFVAMGLAEAGFLEEASAFATVFVVKLVSFMYAAGILTRSAAAETAAREAAGTDTPIDRFKEMIRTTHEAYLEWMSRSSMIRWVLMAAAYAVGFMILRGGMLSVISFVGGNKMLMIATAVGLGTVLVGPKFFIEFAEKLQSREAEAAKASAPATSHTPTPAPAKSAPVQARPAPAAKPTRVAKRKPQDQIQTEGEH